MGVWIETPVLASTEGRSKVTPFVGVWIETSLMSSIIGSGKVTPFVGVWIETTVNSHLKAGTESHPSWVCGLKLLSGLILTKLLSHTLRGCVD